MNEGKLPEYVFYAIEEDAEPGPDGEPQFALLPRYDEHGEGTPLLYLTRDAAEAVIRETSEATGCFGYQRAVEVRVTARFPEPHYCYQHDVWGPESEHLTCSV